MGIKDGKFGGAPGDKYTPHFSVRSSRFRYTLCGNGEEELYDHETDPNEWTNLLAHRSPVGAEEANSSLEYMKARKQLREQLINILRTTRLPKNFSPGRVKDK